MPLRVVGIAEYSLALRSKNFKGYVPAGWLGTEPSEGASVRPSTTYSGTFRTLSPCPKCVRFGRFGRGVAVTHASASGWTVWPPTAGVSTRRFTRKSMTSDLRLRSLTPWVLSSA